MAELDITIPCGKCGLTKACDQFYFDKRRGRHRTRCIACCKANPSPNSGKRTPERRAEYRRERGEASGAYVPQSQRLAIAAEKRLSQQVVTQSAHVTAWKFWTAMELRREAIRALHDAHVRLFRNGTHDWRARYKTNPEFALKQRLRTQQRKQAKLFPKLDDLVRDAINRGGESRTVADVCGYTIADLKVHLERQFTDGMDWVAFMSGEIHIDHIKPQRLFNLADIEGVRACWALSNLQPLWARDNLTKSDRVNGMSVRASGVLRIARGYTL